MYQENYIDPVVLYLRLIYSIYSKTVAGGKFHGAYIKQNTQKNANKQTDKKNDRTKTFL